MRRSTRITAAVATVPLMLAGVAGVATADDVSNNLDTTVDAVAEQMPLTLGGSTGSTVLRIIERNNDGKQGCNLTGGTKLVLAIQSADSSVATVSPSSVEFTSCGQTQTLTVTPLKVGTSKVTATQTLNTTAGSFNLAPAEFDVQVSLPPNTAPSIEVNGVTHGGRYVKGAVPAAACDVTDTEDGPSSRPATLSEASGPDGLGMQTASCSYTDAGGLTAAASKTYEIYDATAPGVGYTLNPIAADGLDSWYRSNVTLTWHVSEPDSPSTLAKTGCVDQHITSDQAATTYSCTASSAGGSSEVKTVTIKRDATAPSVSRGAVAGMAGSNGWYTSDVTVTFNATDALSGPASGSAQATSVGEGASVRVDSPTFSDLAGNTAAAGSAYGSYKIDKTAPNVWTTGGPAAGSYYFGEVPAAPNCGAEDPGPGSGIAGSCVVSGYGTGLGTHTYRASVSDVAGHSSQSPGVSYDVLAWRLAGFTAPVDMGNVWNSVKAGSTVPLKFRAFASSELTQTGAVKSFTHKQVACPGASALVDQVEETVSGGTSLRYDTTGGQFIQNWQTAKSGAGTCRSATLTLQDGSTATANFILK